MAQPLPAAGGEGTDVELVLVDVLVEDRAGKAVLDLEKEDFTLLVDGQERAISQFSRPALATAAPEAVGGPSASEDSHPDLGTPRAEPRPLLIIYIDDRNLLPLGRHRSLTQIGNVLAGEASRQTAVMIASYDGSVRVLLPPSTNRKRISTVLTEKLLYGSQSLLAGRQSDSVMRTIKQALEVDVEALLNRIPPDQIMETACNSTHGFARAHAQGVFGQVESAAVAMQEFVRSLAAFSGRKTLVYVSDGSPLVPGQEPVDYLISLCDGSRIGQGLEPGSVLECCRPARQYPSSARLEMQELNTSRLWNRVAAEANRSRTTLYSLQASGLEVSRAGTVSDVRTGAATETAAWANDQDPLFMVADETGGRALLNTNDFEPALRRMIDESALRYELAFIPEGNDEGVHRIEVKVREPGTRLLFRKSYIAQTAVDQMTTSVLAALYHGAGENGLRVKVNAEQQASAKRGALRHVDISIRVPLKRVVLLPENDRLGGLLTIMLTARNEQGATLPVASKSIPLSVGVGDDNEEFRYVVRIPVQSGHDWRFIVGVRDDLGGTTAFVAEDLQVP